MDSPPANLTAYTHPRLRLRSLTNLEQRKWTDRTNLEREFGSDAQGLQELCGIAKYFGEKRPENDLLSFLEAMTDRIRLCDGFIWPLLDQLRDLRNQTVVLLILLCPLHEHGLNTGNPSCFTDFFIDGAKKCKLPYY